MTGRADQRLTGARPACHDLLSTKHREGVGPGAPVHFPLYSGPTELIRITEGVFKADLATLHTDILTVGLPGVNAYRRAADACHLVNAKTARVAFDADANKNLKVARCLANCVISLRKADVTVELERWAPEDGKGIDDLLATGKTPEVVRGIEAVDEGG